MPPRERRTKRRPRAWAMERPRLVLPTPGGPTKQRMGLRSLAPATFLTAIYSRTLSFTFSSPKWLSFRTWEARARVLVVRGLRAPGKRPQPVQIGADDADLGGNRGHQLQPFHFLLGLFPDL